MTTQAIELPSCVSVQEIVRLRSQNRLGASENGQHLALVTPSTQQGHMRLIHSQGPSSGVEIPIFGTVRIEDVTRYDAIIIGQDIQFPDDAQRFYVRAMTGEIWRREPYVRPERSSRLPCVAEDFDVSWLGMNTSFTWQQGSWLVKNEEHHHQLSGLINDSSAAPDESAFILVVQPDYTGPHQYRYPFRRFLLVESSWGEDLGHAVHQLHSGFCKLRQVFWSETGSHCAVFFITAEDPERILRLGEEIIRLRVGSLQLEAVMSSLANRVSPFREVTEQLVPTVLMPNGEKIKLSAGSQVTEAVVDSQGKNVFFVEQTSRGKYQLRDAQGQVLEQAAQIWNLHLLSDGQLRYNKVDNTVDNRAVQLVRHSF